MAEASCSGGTPFKRLIDHQSSSAHHQDRLVDRAGGNTSFRSSPSHNQSQNGFGAFVRGGPNAGLPSFAHDPAGRLAAHASSLQPVQAFPQRASPVADLSSNWAADFSLFSAQQQQQQQRQQQHNNPMMTTMTHSQPQHQALQSAFAQPSTSFGSAFGMGMNMANGAFMAPPPPPGMAQHHQQPPVGGQSDFDREMNRWMSVHGGGNMQDVDAMMDQMAREIEQQEAQSAAKAAEAEREGARLTDLDAPELGNLSLLEPEAKQGTRGDASTFVDPTGQDTPHAPPFNTANNNILHNEDLENEAENEQQDTNLNNTKSAVAEAAEKLLDAVHHEGGEKWQNSVFLSLMRDFRDGRKDIVGDEIITAGEAVSPELSPPQEPQQQQEQQAQA